MSEGNLPYPHDSAKWRRCLYWLGVGLLLIIVLTGCRATESLSDSTTDRTLTVFAGASLNEAFSEIGRQFEAQHPGQRVLFNFAGSQQLAQQLSLGAPADIFASANQRQMAIVIENGRVAANSSQIFTHNRLVVVVPPDNPAQLDDLSGLAHSNIRLILAAPEVPVGQYSLDFLEKASQDGRYGLAFRDRVLANVVSYEPNVRTVLTKVALGEVDAAIVYTSDVVSHAAEVGTLPIPDALNSIVHYPIAPIGDSAHQEMALAFIQFILSVQGQQILTTYGFIPLENR